MKVGTILTATDTSPLYCEFIPIFIAAWKKLIPNANICIVLIADVLPTYLKPYENYIKLFSPIPGMHTAFQAQCIRLFYPRCIQRDEGVLITDMDMIPMRASYYTEPIEKIPSDTFVAYRDVCLPKEISICYNIAHPKVWESMFGSASIEDNLRNLYSTVSYDGTHGGSGWETDQVYLASKFHEWNGPKKILNDQITGFRRLDRSYPNQFANHMILKSAIQLGLYADYHCLRPYSTHKEINDFILDCI